MEWSLLLWSLFPETAKLFKSSVELDFNLMTWILFKSLAYRLEKSIITSLVDDTIDWIKVWEELDKKYKVE